MSLYVSGTLKNKVATNCKEQTIDIYDDCFDEYKYLTISYDGELSASVFEQDKIIKLERRQEEYIDNGINRINDLVKQSVVLRSLKTDINNIIKKIKDTNRNITYILLEYFYKILFNARITGEVLIKLIEFDKFIDYISGLGNISQVELEVIMDLYYQGHSFDDASVKKEMFRKFNIINEDDLSSDVRRIIKYGEFVAPERVSKISNDLMRDEEYTWQIALMYFALKDEKAAQNFLRLCKRPNIDSDIVEKNAKLCRTPKNIIEMTIR